jgi:hypothetical protein
LTLLLFGFVGCQKEAAVQLPKPQDLQVELRANYCGGDIRDVAGWFGKAAANVWFPVPTATKAEPTIKTGINGTIAFQRIGTNINYAIDFTRGVKRGPSEDLKDAIGSAGTGKDAHHIIPWNTRDNVLVQRAAKAGFHPNDVINGIGLLSYIDHPGKTYKFHTQVTTTYDVYVREILNRYAVSPNYQTPEKAYKFIACGLIPRLRTLLIDAQDEQLEAYNDYKEGVSKIRPVNLNYPYCSWQYGNGKTSCNASKDKLMLEIPGYPLE